MKPMDAALSPLERRRPAADRHAFAFDGLRSLMKAAVLLAPALGAAACAAGSRPAPQIEAPAASPAQATDVAGGAVWTSVPNKAVSTRVGVMTLPHVFTRLDVLGQDGAVLAVTCRTCAPTLTGYVTLADLVSAVLPMEEAALAGLPEFLLAIRDAAQRTDLETLRPVMAPDFSYDFIGVQSPEAAFEVWRAEDFAALGRVPELLDQGIASDDQRIWVSPPAFLTDLGYQGQRLGFRRRPDGRWEWLFLIRGIR